MSELNVLILSAGRRVELVKCSRRAAKRLGIKSHIIAANCSDTAPALYFADTKCKLPRVDAPNYIESVINRCVQHKVALVVPEIDACDEKHWNVSPGTPY
jgi:carbamoyl-phosphate synthase large subunit